MAVGRNPIVVLPIWTTANEPTVPTTGQVGFNLDDGEFVGWDGSAWVALTGGGGGGGTGDEITVNGSSGTDGNFNDTTPAAGAGDLNVKWQKSGSGPQQISAYVDVSALEPLVSHANLTTLTWASSGHVAGDTGSTWLAGFNTTGAAVIFELADISHAALGNLLWADCGHISGVAATRFAMFDNSGDTILGTAESVADLVSPHVIIDHAAQLDSLAWLDSGHISEVMSIRIAAFDSAGDAALYSLADLATDLASSLPHADITGLQWDVSGHTSGESSPRIAGFDSSGNPVLYTQEEASLDAIKKLVLIGM